MSIIAVRVWSVPLAVLLAAGCTTETPASRPSASVTARPSAPSILIADDFLDAAIATAEKSSGVRVRGKIKPQSTFAQIDLLQVGTDAQVRVTAAEFGRAEVVRLGGTAYVRASKSWQNGTRTFPANRWHSAPADSLGQVVEPFTTVRRLLIQYGGRISFGPAEEFEGEPAVELRNTMDPVSIWVTDDPSHRPIAITGEDPAQRVDFTYAPHTAITPPADLPADQLKA